MQHLWWFLNGLVIVIIDDHHIAGLLGDAYQLSGQVHICSVNSLPPSISQITFLSNSFAFASESYNDSKVSIHDVSSATGYADWSDWATSPMCRFPKQKSLTVESLERSVGSVNLFCPCAFREVERGEDGRPCLCSFSPSRPSTTVSEV